MKCVIYSFPPNLFRAVMENFKTLPNLTIVFWNLSCYNFQFLFGLRRNSIIHGHRHMEALTFPSWSLCAANWLFFPVFIFVTFSSGPVLGMLSTVSVTKPRASPSFLLIHLSSLLTGPQTYSPWPVSFPLILPHYALSILQNSVQWPFLGSSPSSA